MCAKTNSSYYIFTEVDEAKCAYDDVLRFGLICAATVNVCSSRRLIRPRPTA